MSSGGPFNFGFLEEFGVPLRRVKAGETLFRAGEPGDVMLLVIEGKIDIRVGEATVETLGLHGIAGEMSLIDESGSKRALYALHQTYLGEMQAFVATSCRDTGAPPSRDAFRARALEQLKTSGFEKMDALAKTEP